MPDGLEAAPNGDPNGKRQQLGMMICSVRQCIRGGMKQIRPRHANLLESYLWGPSLPNLVPRLKDCSGCYQMIGDVWEWISSEYVLFSWF